MRTDIATTGPNWPSEANSVKISGGSVIDGATLSCFIFIKLLLEKFLYRKSGIWLFVKDFFFFSFHCYRYTVFVCSLVFLP